MESVADACSRSAQGWGIWSAQLEDLFETYGMDLNHWAVGQSKAVVNKSVLQTSSAEEIPFEDELFDVVIIKHIVEHLPNPEKAIAEIGRVTAPGGVLILSTPNLDSLLKPWKGDRWIGYQDPTHISLHSRAKWLDWIKNSGFSLMRVFADGFWDVPYIRFVPKEIQKLFLVHWGDFKPSPGWYSCPCAGERVSWWLRENSNSYNSDEQRFPTPNSRSA